MNNLACSYHALGRNVEATQLHEKTLFLRKAKFVPNHPATLKSMSNLAESYAATGRHADALKLYEVTLELRKAKLGSDHPDTLTSLNRLAWFLATCPNSKFLDAARAVELSKKTALARDSQPCWNTLGVAQYRAANWHEAIISLGRSMELGDGGNSFDWFFLAMANWQQGHKDAARKWFDKAVLWMDKNRPKDEELRRFRAEAATLLGIKDGVVNAQTPEPKK
jgi:tetratricopeptide (TPR) repeat protein